METKKYYAKDLSTIMEQVKNDLGADAIIIKSRRTRKKGLLGLFQKPIYEVVVSYSPEDEPAALPADAQEESTDAKPLAEFGNDYLAKQRSAMKKAAVAAANAAAAQKLEQAAAPIKAVKNAKAVSVDFEDSPEAFARLMELAEELEVESVTESVPQPAWVTPATKLGAYVSMQQTKAREAPAPPAMQAAQATPQAQAAQAPMQAHPTPKPPPVRPAPNLRPSKPATWISADRIAYPGAEESYPSIEQEAFPALHIAAAAAVAPSTPADPAAPPKRGRGRPRKDQSAPAPQAAAPKGEQSVIANRLDVVEEMLRALMDATQKSSKSHAAHEGAAQAMQGGGQPEDLDMLLQLRDRLILQDVDVPVAEALTEAAQRYRAQSGMHAQAAIERALTDALGKPKYLRGSTKTARTVMLIGPTGVGKTTTLVKLAAGCIFERKAKVAIINADVFRVGAQDQLNAYAKILDVPLKTIYSAEDLERTIDSFADKDFIFIDTCGKASDDKDYQNEIRQLIKYGKVQDVYLVVSSTTSGRVCRQIVQSYSFIKQYKTILTKLDESGSFGGAVNLCYYSGQPLSYVTIGQNVPDDITKADTDEVIGRLLK